jgi:hypothetical protein
MDGETVKRVVGAAQHESVGVHLGTNLSLANTGTPEAKEVSALAYEDRGWSVRSPAANAAGTPRDSKRLEASIQLSWYRGWGRQPGAKSAPLGLCPQVEKELVDYFAADVRPVRNNIILRALG